MIIHVSKLKKVFEKRRQRPGLVAAFKNLFSREKISVEAVKEISFDIAEGEFVGFVGPNGAGKTTTLKMLSGILYPTSGEARVLGAEPWKRDREFQKKISLVMGQKNQMWWDLAVEESFEFNRTVYEIPRHEYEKQKNLLIELLSISHLLETQVRKLSLGERMKCELATALLHEPTVLFLDEPTIGLDVVSQKAIRDFLSTYNREKRATIILTSHYMEDIRRLCDRVIIIDHGELMYDGNFRKLISEHATTKTIEMVFSERVDRSRLERLGTLSEFRETSGRLTIPRKSVTEITTELLKNFPVDDISIHEENIEEIVREIFVKNNI